jgi:hypothetical protein
MTQKTPTSEKPRYLLHRATTDAFGGVVSGGVFETDGEPNVHFEPLNTAAYLRCLQAGLDPHAWRGQEAAAIAVALKEKGPRCVGGGPLGECK